VRGQTTGRDHRDVQGAHPQLLHGREAIQRTGRLWGGQPSRPGTQAFGLRHPVILGHHQQVIEAPAQLIAGEPVEHRAELLACART
jgi:hypothetical protein